jgi:hypothetical protein
MRRMTWSLLMTLAVSISRLGKDAAVRLFPPPPPPLEPGASQADVDKALIAAPPSNGRHPRARLAQHRRRSDEASRVRESPAVGVYLAARTVVARSADYPDILARCSRKGPGERPLAKTSSIARPAFQNSLTQQAGFRALVDHGQEICHRANSDHVRIGIAGTPSGERRELRLRPIKLGVVRNQHVRTGIP